MRKKPIFKNGDIVKYNSEKMSEFLNYAKNNPGARLPICKLKIYRDPEWSDKFNTWIYDYEYDFTSEGSAIETDLVLYKY